MFGGDVVKEVEAKVVGWFAQDEVEVYLAKGSLWEPRQGHIPEGEQYGSEWTSTRLICSPEAELECSNSAMALSADMSWALIH